MKFRDVNETKDWMGEKDEALNNDKLEKIYKLFRLLKEKMKVLKEILLPLGTKFISLTIKIFLRKR